MGGVIVSVLIMLALTLGGRPVWAEGPPALEESAAAIERVSTERDGTRVVVGHLSRRLRISSDTLQEQRQRTGLNWGQLFIAYRLGKEKGLTFDQVVAEFKGGKSWETIATEHKVDLNGLRLEVWHTQAVVERREEDKPAPALGDTTPRPPPKQETPNSNYQLPGKPQRY